jgi:H+/Cl- antiporter ClcA
MSTPHIVVLLTSRLPDPGSYMILPFGGVIGGFVGGLVGRLRRLPAERIVQLTGAGMFWGTGGGLVVWLIALAIYAL